MPKKSTNPRIYKIVNIVDSNIVKCSVRWKLAGLKLSGKMCTSGSFQKYYTTTSFKSPATKGGNKRYWASSPFLRQFWARLAKCKLGDEWHKKPTCAPRIPGSQLPDRPFHEILEPQNLSIDVSELNELCRSTDFEALNFRKGRSGEKQARKEGYL